MRAALVRALGADPAAFAVLHRAFWTLSRRATSGLVQSRDDAKPRGVAQGLWMYLLFGSLVAMGAAMATRGAPREAYGTIALGSTLFLVALGVVADFAAVVVAPGDDEVLFHLPLSSRTYLAARLSVAARHTTMLTLAFAAMPAIVGAVAFKSPVYAATFVFAAVWTGLFALVLSFLVYRVGLRLLGGERLRTLLAYVPGVVSLVTMLGPQLLPSGAAPAAGRETARVVEDPVSLLLPPAWFSALAEAPFGGLDADGWLRAAIGFLVVPVGGLLLVRALGRGFLADLQRLVAGRDAGTARAEAAVRPSAPGRLARALFPLSTPEARAGWLLYAGGSRSRATRARIFPLLALPFAFAALGAFRPRGGGATFAAVAPYMVAAAAGSLVALLPHHEHRDGAWLIEATPGTRYGRFRAGMIWSLFARHVLPPAAAMVALATFVSPTVDTLGWSLHATAGALLLVAFWSSVTANDVPFSRPFQTGEQGSRVWQGIASMVLLGLLGGVQAILTTRLPWAFLATVPAMVALSALWMRDTAARLDAVPPEALRPATPWASARDTRVGFSLRRRSPPSGRPGAASG